MLTIAYINYWVDPKNDRFFTKFIEANIGNVIEISPFNKPDILIASIWGNINIIHNLKAKCKIFYYEKI